jgi:hypothetical protein
MNILHRPQVGRRVESSQVGHQYQDGYGNSCGTRRGEDRREQEVIDRGDVTPWISRQPRSPKDVFDQYVRSYRDGEFKVTRETRRGQLVETTTYIFGGVDFIKVPRANLSGEQFKARSPDLSHVVSQSLAQPVPEPDGKAIWLGGAATVPSQARPDNGHFSPPLVLLIIVGFFVVVCSAPFVLARFLRGSR